MAATHPSPAAPRPVHGATLLVCIGLAAGCGGSYEPAVVTSPFTEEQAQVFEDGLDYVNDPTALEGRWREDWSRELQSRVSWADFIGVIHIQTLRTDTTPDHEVTYRLIGTVERSLLGEPPAEEVSLVVREGGAGFESVRNNERRVLNQNFVAFIKWYQGDNEEILPHWHLSPGTEPVLDRTQWLIRHRRAEDSDTDEDDRRVIVVE